MPIGIDQLNHALEPLRVVDVETLEGVAKALKGSQDKRKPAAGVSLARVNHYRPESSSKAAKKPQRDLRSGLKDPSN